MSFSKISIVGKSGTLLGLQILLDGQPVLGLHSLTLDLSGDEANTVTLGLFVDGIQVDAEALAILEAKCPQTIERCYDWRTGVTHLKIGGQTVCRMDTREATDELVNAVIKEIAKRAVLAR